MDEQTHYKMFPASFERMANMTYIHPNPVEPKENTFMSDQMHKSKQSENMVNLISSYSRYEFLRLLIFIILALRI